MAGVSLRYRRRCPYRKRYICELPPSECEKCEVVQRIRLLHRVTLEDFISKEEVGECRENVTGKEGRKMWAEGERD